MTRRIAITILLTVWGAIFVAGGSAWIASWFILLRNLDRNVLDLTKAHVGARGVITDRNSSARRIYEIPDPDPVGQEWSFNHLPQGWYRVLHTDAGVFELPADNFFETMTTLGLAIVACGLVAGGVGSFAARRVANVALRPLNATAEVIGAIDESQLDRRIEPRELPVELRPMADRLNEMLGRLGTAFNQRRRFLADASHELRTPVAAMITTMEVALRRPRTAPELTETLETCLSEARHMRLLVQALLRQVRAEGIAGNEEPQDVDAGEMLNQCAELAGSLAAERSINLVRRVKGKIPVRAELGRLRSVVLNLVSNAIEYNAPGGTVELSAQTDGDDTEIIVKDNGPGISPEHLPHLFQPFYRATKAREADGHLGLGLFLVDSHVKAMGGQCRVESALGAGTTFRVRLPSSSLPSPGIGGLYK
jgi:signal transduction histidine kinase